MTSHASFDPETVEQVVRGLPPVAAMLAVPPGSPWFDPPYGMDLYKAVTSALEDHYGQWARYWRVPELPAWRWLNPPPATPELTVAAIVHGVRRARAQEDENQALLAPLLPLSSVEAWEAAVHTMMLNGLAEADEEYTYGLTHRRLHDLLAAAGVPAPERRALVEDAIGGRFSSWVTPDPGAVDEIELRFTASVTGRAAVPEWPDQWSDEWPRQRPISERRAYPILTPPTRPHGDDLQEWHRIRATVDWATITRPVTGPSRGSRDAIASYLGLPAALDQVRAAAAEGGPLTFALLSSWQRTVLDVPEAPFRNRTAWAKGGRERYYYSPELPELFDAYLAEATDPAIPLPSRAARVYLDVAFHHPFFDGNARSATLALYYVLAREGVILSRATAIMRHTQRAGSAPGAVALAAMIATIARLP